MMVKSGRALSALLLAVVLAACSSSESSSGPKAPSAPTGVSATAGDAQVSLSWTAESDATSYNVYWATTSNVTTASGTKVTGATSPYVQTGLTNTPTLRGHCCECRRRIGSLGRGSGYALRDRDHRRRLVARLRPRERRRSVLGGQ